MDDTGEPDNVFVNTLAIDEAELSPHQSVDNISPQQTALKMNDSTRPLQTDSHTNSSVDSVQLGKPTTHNQKSGYVVTTPTKGSPAVHHFNKSGGAVHCETVPKSAGLDKRDSRIIEGPSVTRPWRPFSDRELEDLYQAFARLVKADYMLTGQVAGVFFCLQSVVDSLINYHSSEMPLLVTEAVMAFVLLVLLLFCHLRGIPRWSVTTLAYLISLLLLVAVSLHTGLSSTPHLPGETLSWHLLVVFIIIVTLPVGLVTRLILGLVNTITLLALVICIPVFNKYTRLFAVPETVSTI